MITASVMKEVRELFKHFLCNLETVEKQKESAEGVRIISMTTYFPHVHVITKLLLVISKLLHVISKLWRQKHAEW